MANEGGNEPISDVIGVVDHLGGRIISLLGWIFFLTFFAFAVFAGAYFYVLLDIAPEDRRRSEALPLIEHTVTTIWEKLLPIGEVALRIVAPVIVLLLATGLVLLLSRRGQTPLDIGKLITDFPSLLALLIVVTICLLPLSGLPVPDVLNNVALVIVGFYFGKKFGAAAGPMA